MTRIISSRIAVALAGTVLLAAPAAAQDAATQKEEAVCQLLDNCATAPADPAAAPPRGTPRGSATRGFSLARPKGDATAPAAPSGNATRAGKSATAKAKPAKVSPGVGRYDLNVTFRTASADLAPSARSRVTTFAGALQDPRLAGRRVRIEGHTDSVGDAARNRDLSERRARTVADMLIASGVEQGRLDVAGFGSSQPLPGLATTDGAQRRVVAVLVK